jgi:hypothetical protein
VEGNDALVETYIGSGLRKVVHPSYQAWSYCALLEDYNANVQDRNIKLVPCAYLHNYKKDRNDAIEHPIYKDYLKKAPVFAHGDIGKLRAFIKRFIKQGDNRENLYLIEKGQIRPSKSLQDALTGMLQGNREFIMIDEQKVVYEEALELAMKSKMDGKKRVYIVKGGPGTGKSVVAVNLLVELTNRGQFCQYVSKNSAPRNVYVAKLTGSFKKSHINNLFKGYIGRFDILPARNNMEGSSQALYKRFVDFKVLEDRVLFDFTELDAQGAAALTDYFHINAKNDLTLFADSSVSLKTERIYKDYTTYKLTRKKPYSKRSVISFKANGG